MKAVFAILLLFSSLHLGAQSFVVLELFTSQGCSSCPSADKVFTELEKEYNGTLIQLSFHVDYWDRLGWKDLFGSAEYSQRQRAYVSRMEQKTVYTPQIIVNGKTQMVGSEGKKVKDAINNADSINKVVKIGNVDYQQGEYDQNISIFLSGEIENTITQVAIVEDGLVTKILRGENKGKELKYNNVVRQFESMKSAKNNSIQLKIPKKVNLEKAQLVVLVQEMDTYHIWAAKAYDLKKE